MRALHAAVATCLLATTVPPAVAHAQETCGNLVNDGDPASTHLVDEGCNPAAVTGVCESPISCGRTGAVAPRTGQLVYNEPADIAPQVPFGPPLALSRNYASLAADQSGYLGSLGKGWRHSFMGWLDPATAETDEVIVRLVTGQEVLFTFDDEDPTSTYDLYTAQPGYHVDVLRRHQTSDVWELITLDGWTYQYDDSSCGGLRMLTRIEDPFGQGVGLTYDGSCYLTEVSDASGFRSLQFTYASNKLDKVDYVLDGDIQVTVDYTVTSDKLEDVTVGSTLIRDYTWTGNKLDLIEDGEAKDIADFEYLSAAAGKVARIKTGEGNIGYRYGDTECDGGQGVLVFYNDTDETDGGCDADEDCPGDTFCGGDIGTGSTEKGVCYRAWRCVATSASYDDLVDSVTSSCPTCADTTSYLWDATPGLGLGLVSTHDGEDVQTTYLRNADGLVTRMVENDDDDDASDFPTDARVTYYFYDSTFRGKIAEIRRKSELAIPELDEDCAETDTTACKQTSFTYEATAGNGAALTSVREQGRTFDWVSGSLQPVDYDYTTSYDFDSIGRLVEIDGPRTGYDQVSFTYWTSTSEPARHAMLHEVSRALGSSSALTTTYDDYDSWGNAGSIEDPNGNFTCRTFHADLDVETVHRVAMNNQTSCATSNSADLVTTTTYDTAKRVTKVEEPRGNCTHRAYDDLGRLSVIRERDDCTLASGGHKMELTYNDDGLVIKTEYIDGSTVTYRRETTYGEDRRLLEIINPTQTTKKKTLAYHDDGTLAGITGEDGVGETEWTYDALNRAILEQRHLDGTTTDDFGIQNCKQMERVVDVQVGPSGFEQPVIQRSWDDLGRNIAQTSPDGGTSLLIHDEAGNVTTRVDAWESSDEKVHEFTYDSLNRLLTEDFGDTNCTLGGPEIEYSYDASSACPSGVTCDNPSGRLVSVRTQIACYDDGSGGDDSFEQFTYFSYDDAGRTVRETIKDDGGRNITQNYAWDKNGNQTLAETPSGVDMKWTYGSSGSNSDANRVVSVVRDPGSGDVTLLSNAVWYPFGPIKEYQQANTVSSNNIVARFTSDLAYRSTQLLWEQETSGTDLFKIDLAYDAQGRIVSRDFSSADSAVNDAWYLYDWQNRILCDATTAPSGSTCPSGTDRKNQLTDSPPYTPAGDRLELYHQTPNVYVGNTYTYSYVTDTHQIDEIDKATGGAISFGWDGRGNRLYDDDDDWADDRRDYTYDARDNLVTISGKMKISATVVHDYSIVNAYDHKNRRFFKSLLDEDTDVEAQWFYYYDLQDRLIEVNYKPDITQSDYQLVQFYWIGTRPVARMQTTYPSGTQARRFLHADELGTPLDSWTWPIGSGSASRVWAWNPDAFGWGAVVQGAGNYQPLRFPGQMEDEETTAWHYNTGTSDYRRARPPLNDNRYRVYDPLTGTYLQADPEVATSWNAYSYVNSSPISNVDPDGRLVDKQGDDQCFECTTGTGGIGGLFAIGGGDLPIYEDPDERWGDWSDPFWEEPWDGTWGGTETPGIPCSKRACAARCNEIYALQTSACSNILRPLNVIIFGPICSPDLENTVCEGLASGCVADARAQYNQCMKGCGRCLWP